MTAEFSFPTADSFDWEHPAGDVVYAPSVPMRERTPAPYGKRALARFRDRWGDRVLFRDEVVYRLAGERHGRPRYVYEEVEIACRVVWGSARPLAGVLDLREVVLRLDRERWACLQLGRQLTQVKRKLYTTEAAEKVLVEQLEQRLSDLSQWAEQNRRLYAEYGADPASLPDAVAHALAVAQAQEDERPARDTAVSVRELRRLLTSLEDR